MREFSFIIIFSLFSLFAVSALYADETGVAKWHEWISGQQNYLDKVEALMESGKKIALQQNSDLQEAIKKNDKELGEKVIAGASKRLSAIVDVLKAIDPPAEFKEYHEKVIEAYTYRAKANEATLQKDIVNIRNYSHAAMASEIEAMENIEKLYAGHGAPPQLINSIERNVESYRQRLASN